MSTKPEAIMLYKDFLRKGRNVRWVLENGWEAVPILLAVWIESSDERDCQMRKEDILAIPILSHFTKEKVMSVLSSAVKEGLLEENDGCYFNSTTAAEHENFVRKQKNYKKGHQSRKMNSSRNQDEIKLNSSRNQNEITLNYNECELSTLSNEDLNLDLDNCIPIPSLDTSEVRHALKLWQRHLVKLKRKLDQISLEGILGQYAGRPSDLIEDINYTAGAGWKTLCRKPKAEARAPSDKKKSNFDRNIEMLKDNLTRGSHE